MILAQTPMTWPDAIAFVVLVVCVTVVAGIFLWRNPL